MFTFGSLFSGIGGFDLGLERAGLGCHWQVEIDSGCQDVLQKHWDVVRYGDVRDCGENLEPVDVICGGFPCQDLSVAGRRKGLAGERSGLWFEFHRLVTSLEPRWVIVENVPGLLSSDGGRDFAIILRGLVKCGYGVTWRILDAQYFGVAQRRRRVFIVGSLGDGNAAEILFERESSTGDTPPCREAGAGVASTITERFGGCSNQWPPINEADNLQVAYALPAEVRGTGDGHGQGWNSNYVVQPVASPITAGYAKGSGVNDGKKGSPQNLITVAPSITAHHGRNNPDGQPFAIVGHFGVRRLTPIECERLQGFPDGWTSGQSDSVRYRQLGNAVCVPVAEWIGKRLLQAASPSNQR